MKRWNCWCMIIIQKAHEISDDGNCCRTLFKSIVTRCLTIGKWSKFSTTRDCFTVLTNNSSHFIISDSGFLILKLHFGLVYILLDWNWLQTGLNSHYYNFLGLKICRCWSANSLAIYLDWSIWTKSYKCLKNENSFFAQIEK